jgi:hypothetical protein
MQMTSQLLYCQIASFFMSGSLETAARHFDVAMNTFMFSATTPLSQLQQSKLYHRLSTNQSVSFQQDAPDVPRHSALPARVLGGLGCKFQQNSGLLPKIK